MTKRNIMDEIFDYNKEVIGSHGNATIVRNNIYNSKAVVLEGVNTDDQHFYTSLELDEAEALAYRLLYAVKRSREDTDG